jgi:hypothetical protein
VNYESPTHSACSVGILLYDRTTETLHLQFRDTWESFDEDDTDYLSSVADDFVMKVQELGPAVLLRYLEDTLSNTLTLSERVPVKCVDPIVALSELFRRHVL